MNISIQGHSDSTFSNSFSFETARPIAAKFHVEPPLDGQTKECSNGLGHMTNMTTMLIYGKNLKKSSLEPNVWLLWNLVCSIGYSSTTKFVQMMTLTYFMARSNLIPYAFIWKKGKTMDFSETIVVFDIKVGRCSQLNEPVWISKVKVIHWPSSKITQFQHFQTSFP